MPQDSFDFIERTLHLTMVRASGVVLTEVDRDKVLELMREAANIAREATPPPRRRTPTKPKAPEPEDTTPVVIELPLRSGEMFAVRESHRNALRGAYPLVDTRSMLLQVSIWLNANPGERPTSKMMSFLNTWARREQEKAERQRAFRHNQVGDPRTEPKRYQPSTGQDPEVAAEMRRRRESRRQDEAKPEAAGNVVRRLFGGKGEE